MFRTQDEEIKELTKELRELKDVLRDISSKVAQIERRVHRSIPAAFPKQPSPRRGQVPKLSEPASISSQEALAMYDELVRLAKERKKEAVRRQLEEMPLPDLALLARELGAPLGGKKPSRKTLVSAVLGRVNESVMLSASNLRNTSESKQGASGSVSTAHDTEPAKQKE